MEKENKNKSNNHICRAAISATDGSDWDFEAVAVPVENMQVRYSYENGEYFKQVLGIDRSNIDTSRLDIGLNLFDNHPYDNSASNTLGVTVGYDFDSRGLVVRCKFGARADEALRSDIKNGIIKTVSIEGEVLTYEITRKQGEVPTYLATMWTPTSLSFAPVPNDIGATIDVARSKTQFVDVTEKTEEETKEKEITRNLFTNLTKKIK